MIYKDYEQFRIYEQQGAQDLEYERLCRERQRELDFIHFFNMLYEKLNIEE